MSAHKRGWIVIARMHQEIANQQQLGSGGTCTIYDEAGRIAIHGVIDLPALAVATEKALREMLDVEHER